MSRDSSKTNRGFGTGIWRPFSKDASSVSGKTPHGYSSMNADNSFGKTSVNNGTRPVIRELGKDDYAGYSVGAGQSIYVRIAKNDAFLDDDAPVIIDSADSEFVKSLEDINVSVVPAVESESSVDPLRCFKNAIIPDHLEKIDFNEIIVKSKTSKNSAEGTSMKPSVASADTNELNPVEISGLHMESKVSNNSAVAGEVKKEISDFNGNGLNQFAVTSTGAAKIIQTKIHNDDAAFGITNTKTSDTNSALDITDPVADILRLTVPELNDDEMLIAVFPPEPRKNIPRDGLEGYDAKFKIRETRPKTKVTGLRVDMREYRSLGFTFGSKK